MPRGSLEVVDFVPRQAADAAPAFYTHDSDGLHGRPRLSRTATSCLAAVASIALHALFVAPALWGNGTRPDHAPNQRDAGDTALQWVVLDDSLSASAITPAPLGAPALVAIGLPDVLPPLPAAAPDPVTPKDKAAQSEDHSALGVMYGRYVGQIQARIDRAWRRPRTAIGAPLFQCQVQIDQDEAGRVGDVTLLQCDGDTRWRLSLVHAIEIASPLPAPPNHAVFRRSVLLQFRAMGYSAGVPADLYESAEAAMTNARLNQREALTQGALARLREAAAAPHSHNDLQLRIEGSKIEVGPHSQ